MKKLENWFYRGNKDHSIWYELIKRTDKTVLFKLFVKEEWMTDYEHVGWEVTRIIARIGKEAFGEPLPDAEVLVSDEEFGTEKSKSFFPQDKDDAEKYFIELDEYLHQQEAVSV